MGSLRPARTRLRLLALALAAAAPLVAARPARACPCPSEISAVVPRTDTMSVPTNAQIIVFANRSGKAPDMTGATFDVDSMLKLDVRDASNTKLLGNTVRRQINGITTMFRFEPTDKDAVVQPLPANQMIKVFAVDSAGLSHPVTQFTTGDGPDNDPPGFAGAASFEATLDTFPKGSTCLISNPVSRVAASAAAATDNVTTAADMRYELSYYRAGQKPEGVTVVVLGGNDAIDMVQSSASCGLSTFTSLLPGTSYCAHVTAIDGAGNAKGSDVEVCADTVKRTVDQDGLPTGGGGDDGKGGGCSMGGVPRLGGLCGLALLLGTGVLVRARRRTRR